MASTRQDSNLISSYLDEECSLGRVVGPLDIEAFPIVQCSLMDLVPKGSSGKWWLIVDLSSPEGSSVNDGIDPTLCSLEYVSVDVVAKVVVQLGRGAFLLKVDIRSAYQKRYLSIPMTGSSSACVGRERCLWTQPCLSV